MNRIYKVQESYLEDDYLDRGLFTTEKEAIKCLNYLIKKYSKDKFNIIETILSDTFIDWETEENKDE